MENIIKELQAKIKQLNTRLNTALYIGRNQKIRIDAEIETIKMVINKLRALEKCSGVPQANELLPLVSNRLCPDCNTKMDIYYSCPKKTCFYYVPRADY